MPRPFTGMVCRLFFAVQLICCHAVAQTDSTSTLAGTQPLLDLPADPATAMVAGIDRFALRQLAGAAEQRNAHWQTPSSKLENIEFLKGCLGLPSERFSFSKGSVLRESAPIYSDSRLTVHAVRWPVLAHPAPQLKNSVSLWGEGILIEPVTPINTLAIILPDADESPEEYLGELTNDAETHVGFQRSLVGKLVNGGVTVLIPQLVSRTVIQHGNASLSRREYLHRAAFELGQTLIGYEVQTVQAAFDQFTADKRILCGVGEGGMIALLSSAFDERIDTTICCGYFGPRNSCWSEPLSRNVFGVYSRFADAELGSMLAPRRLIICDQPNFSVDLHTNGGAPASWSSPASPEVKNEFQRMLDFSRTQLNNDAPFATHLKEDSGKLADQVLRELAIDHGSGKQLLNALNPTSLLVRSAARELRLMATIDAHTQAVLEESEYIRSQFLNMGLERYNAPDRHNVVDASSPEGYEESIKGFRNVFSDQIIGKFPNPLLPVVARTQRGYQGERWTGYDVVLDVFPDVFAYGVLLLPNDIGPNEQRPVVVCQHGLEGRPQDIIAGDHYAYHDFAAKLADRGFIVFAPQNPYIGKDDFRTLQRKMNPIGKTLFSVITPQHEQILRWLSSMPQVDSERIAFYGLSYGGKSAMRLPALLPQYCLSICSADFNDWVWKNASSRSPYSYVGTGEYEIFEFNLGTTFNYAEMAALIAPRPFMVERGHFDGVAPDDRVAKEFAKVRFLYAARLGLPEHCEIEWFKGPHTINGDGTFKFLHKHLNWPER